MRGTSSDWLMRAFHAACVSTLVVGAMITGYCASITRDEIREAFITWTAANCVAVAAATLPDYPRRRRDSE